MKIKWPWRKPETDLPAARRAVEEARSDWTRVHRVADRADQLKRENGFGNKILEAMGYDGER